MLSILFLLFAFSEIQTLGPKFEAPIGNYSQYFSLYSQCGLTKRLNERIIEKQNCFKYHKDFFPRIMGARDRHLGEAPWLVGVARSILFWPFTKVRHCTGSLISDQWVITAAHCLTEENFGTSFSIWLGPEFDQGQSIEVDTVHLHPRYNDERDSIRKGLLDIGLIKLKEQIVFGQKGKYYENNLICLPDVNMTIDPVKQFALLSGWGIYDSAQRNDHKLSKISGLQIWLYKDDGIHIYGQMENGLGMTFVSNETRVCNVDAGSPIWMYHMGRAYQIGVYTSQTTGSNDGCSEPWPAIYVPYHMEWILKTIKNS